MEDDLTQPPTDRRGFLQVGKTDLEAGPNKLDFARLLPEVARKLA